MKSSESISASVVAVIVAVIVVDTVVDTVADAHAVVAAVAAAEVTKMPDPTAIFALVKMSVGVPFLRKTLLFEA